MKLLKDPRMLAVLGSLALHALGLGYFAAKGRDVLSAQGDRATNFKVSYVEPPPPPKPEPKPLPKPEPKPLPKEPPPPPPVEERNVEVEPPPPQPEAPPPEVFAGLDKNSFSETEGPATGPSLAAGNTMLAEPERVAPNPEDIKPLAAVPPKDIEARVAPIATITVLPKLKTQGLKPKYTPEAEEAGIEGKVVLQLFIDEKGKVVKVLLVKGLGYGLDENAIKIAYLFEFEPARRGDEPVAMKKPQTFNFVLER